MQDKVECWLEASATVAAVLVIPIYLGFTHVNPGGAIAYAGVGGVAMAVGEELQFRPDTQQLTFSDVVLWTMAIAGVGGAAYVLALLLI